MNYTSSPRSSNDNVAFPRDFLDGTRSPRPPSTHSKTQRLEASEAERMPLDWKIVSLPHTRPRRPQRITQAHGTNPHQGRLIGRSHLSISMCVVHSSLTCSSIRDPREQPRGLALLGLPVLEVLLLAGCRGEICGGDGDGDCEPCQGGASRSPIRHLLVFRAAILIAHLR